jgi:leucyl-tRNA synthetase
MTMSDGKSENRFDFRTIEAKWRARWQHPNLFRVENHSDRPKFYGLDMFPYPSGAGIGVGRRRNYVPLDVACRRKVMQRYSYSMTIAAARTIDPRAASETRPSRWIKRS